MKNRIISMFIAITMVLGMIPAITLPMEAIKNGDWEYRLTNDGFEAEIVRYKGIGSNITTPDTLDGYSVTSIGNLTFAGCTSLTTITIPDSVTSIGSSAFRDCTRLTSIIIPDSVTSIGNLTFAGCTSLTSITIPDSVTSIGSLAFYGCANLTSITIPDRVTSIDSSAFRYCTILTAVNVHPDNLAYSSVDGVLFNKDKSEILQYSIGKTATSYSIPDSVTSIGYGAFAGCTSLTSITIPNSVTSIGNSAFRDCTILTAVNVHPDNLAYSSVDGVLFNKDKSEILQYPIGKTATSYSIPDSVTSIGYGAFEDCTSLTSITIPDSVTSIGGCAFYGCTSLTSITIPDSVTSIGGYTFYVCTSLASITIPDSVTSIGNFAFEDCTSLTSITIPDSVTSIGYGAFEDCTSLTSIIIPDSVTSIGGSAFEGCTSLTSITIPDSVTSIGYGAFEGCTRLISVTFKSATPPSLGSSTFLGCSALNTIYVPVGAKAKYEEVALLSEYNIVEVEVGTCDCQNCELCGFLGGKYGFGKVLGKETVTIVDAVEILKYLAGINSVIKKGNDSWNAALISNPTAAEPTITDALEILKMLAGLPSVLYNSYKVATSENLRRFAGVRFSEVAKYINCQLSKAIHR